MNALEAKEYGIVDEVIGHSLFQDMEEGEKEAEAKEEDK